MLQSTKTERPIQKKNQFSIALIQFNEIFNDFVLRIKNLKINRATGDKTRQNAIED